MFISAFYLIAFKSGELLYTLLYFFCSYVPLSECLCPLLRTLSGSGMNESLFYMVELYLSYYSSSSLNQSSILRVILTSHLKTIAHCYIMVSAVSLQSIAPYNVKR